MKNDLARHHNALLEQQRCGMCAETISPMLALRGGQCTHCDSEVAWRTDDESSGLHRITSSWRRTAVLIYAMVAIASLIGATIPLLQAALFVGAIIFAHLLLLRPALGWLSSGRRLCARVSLKLFAALVACSNLFLDVLLAPLLGVRTLLLSVASVLWMALFLEGSMWMLRRRLDWDHKGAALRVAEWGVPAFLLGSLVMVVAGGSLATVGVLWVLTRAEIPGVSAIATFLLGS